MPTLVRWYIKAALVYFMLALLAALLSAMPIVRIPALTPVFFHALMVGWVTQLIIGVSYWMFPRFSKESPRGPERLGYAIFILLNVGLAFRIVGEPLQGAGFEWAGWLLAISAVLQLTAGWIFVAIIWQRVKER